jgi:hypothetical protein
MATDTGSQTRMSGDGILAVIAGSFVGAILVGLVLQAGLGRGGVLQFGALVARPEYNVSWAVLFVLSTLFTLSFVRFVSRSINGFVTRVISLSRRNEVLKEILVPLLQRSALTVTTNALGIIYGAAIWLVVYVLLIPLWLTFVIGIEQVAIPNLQFAGFFAWVLYGGLVGLLYGLIMES